MKALHRSWSTKPRVEQIYETGQTAEQLLHTSNRTLKSATDQGKSRAYNRVLVLDERNNLAGRREWCIYYNGNVAAHSSETAEARRFLSWDDSAYEAALDHFNRYLERLKLHATVIPVHNKKAS